ncbi:AbrB/MazE/SpoVT family DNA-binding domain-containing protein [Salinicoccus roseus]|uniref:AbrB/MazE/SpoVT family DNA-binding domain-containing protein n=1 Tax=Salinicoccus roseus TaxID=45670 RepID=UPI003DA017F4
MHDIKRKVLHREARIRPWGNSQGVRLTREVLREAGFDPYDTEIEVEVEPNRISLVPKNKLTPFQKLFEGYEGGKPETESLWEEAEPMGKEEW